MIITRLLSHPLLYNCTCPSAGPWPGGSSSSKQGNRDKSSSSLHNAVEDSSYKPAFQPAFPYGYTSVHANLSNHGPSFNSSSHNSYSSQSASEWPDFSSCTSSASNTTASAARMATAGVSGSDTGGSSSAAPGMGARGKTTIMV